MNYTSKELLSMNVYAGEGVCVDNTVKFFGGPFNIGPYTRIDAYSVLTGECRIGKRVHISVGCYLQGVYGLVLEDYSGIAAKAVVYTATDDYTDGYLAGPMIPDDLRKLSYGEVKIGRGSTVGAAAVLLGSLSVGTGAAIGALSLVKRDVPDFAVVAGVPAKQIGTRNEKLFLENLKTLEARIYSNDVPELVCDPRPFL